VRGFVQPKEVEMKARRTRMPSPRNPLALAVRFRRAGAHGAPGRAQRQRAERALRREVDTLKAGP
jgi:hypothetical protein